jgi:hypothetical protein
LGLEPVTTPSVVFMSGISRFQRKPEHEKVLDAVEEYG